MFISASEHWNEEIRICEQITASDNEWTEEACISSCTSLPFNYIKNPFIYNDDVIYCDAD